MLDIFMFIYMIVIGTVIGSFLNVLIYRIPKKLSFVKGRSFCPNCENSLKSNDLVPIFSYLALKGKCRYCSNPISLRYPTIEGLTGILFGFSYACFGLSFEFVINALLICVLIVVAMIDIDIMEIPYSTVIFILLLGIVSLLLNIQGLDIIDRFIGLLAISLPFYIIGYLTNGIGGGDVWLMGAAGFLLGTKAIIVAAFIGIILGGIYGAYQLYVKKTEGNTQMPFGPWLTIGIYIASIYGTSIANWYLSILGM